jgi:DNA-binding MarR family transcriptional regulator
MPGQPDPTAAQLLEVSLQLMRGLAAVQRRAEPGIAPMQIGLLNRLAGTETNLSELARHMAVRLPTISRSIKVLVERGWVERSVSESNRREVIVRLTPDGQKVLAAMRARAGRYAVGVLGLLGAAERRQVATALASLSRALAEHANNDKETQP